MRNGDVAEPLFVSDPLGETQRADEGIGLEEVDVEEVEVDEVLESSAVVVVVDGAAVVEVVEVDVVDVEDEVVDVVDLKRWADGSNRTVCPPAVITFASPPGMAVSTPDDTARAVSAHVATKSDIPAARAPRMGR